MGNKRQRKVAFFTSNIFAVCEFHYLATFISLVHNKENRSNEIISPKIALGKFLERSLSAAVFTVIKIASYYIIF